MSEWQPIDSAPKDGTLVLALVNGTPTMVRWHIPAQPTTFDYGYPWLRDGKTEAYRADVPTHWLPIPVVPTSAPPGYRG